MRLWQQRLSHCLSLILYKKHFVKKHLCDRCAERHLLGFVAYGLSIFLYVRAQNVLGVAKTSAYYAVAPFVGVFLSFVFLRERLSWMYLVALIVMIVGSVLVVVDTLIKHHAHEHQHTFTHTHDGTTHMHTVTHIHEHNHYVTDDKHGHRHTQTELEHLPRAVHS